MACVSVLGSGGCDEIETLIGFVEGRKPWVSIVPVPFLKRNVTSCLPRAKAQRIGNWITKMDEAAFSDEVADMHGDSAVDYYVAVKNSIANVLSASLTHDVDLCCATDMLNERMEIFPRSLPNGYQVSQ